MGVFFYVLRGRLAQLGLVALAVLAFVTVVSYSKRHRINVGKTVGKFGSLVGSTRHAEVDVQKRLGVGRPIRVRRDIVAPGTVFLSRGGLSRGENRAGGDAVTCSIAAIGPTGTAEPALPFSLSRGDSLHIEGTAQGAPGTHAVTAQVFDARGGRRGLRVAFRCDGSSAEVALRLPRVREAVDGFLQVD